MQIERATTGGRERTGARRPLALGASRLLLAGTLALVVLAVKGRSWLSPIDPGVPRLSDVLWRTIETRGVEAAVAEYRGLRQRGFPGLRESEAGTNGLGYKLLRMKEAQAAIAIFSLNVETRPGSENAHDSLAEAYLAAGQRERAIESYRRVVAIAPNHRGALAELQRLTGERRTYRPAVLFHIAGGLVGIGSGAVAMAFRKGSRGHGRAGSVFFVSMLAMSASGALMALFRRPEPEFINVLMGSLTFYLVVTAWSTARRRSLTPGTLDRAAVLVPLAVGAGLAACGVDAARSLSGTRDGIGAGPYFGFGAVALLAASLDLRMIARGGVAGAQRVARHLWRMCVALFIAVGSFFLGQPQVFPRWLRDSGALAVPTLLVVVLLVFWLIRVLAGRTYGRAGPPRPADAVGALP
jgi:hypothetical protein